MTENKLDRLLEFYDEYHDSPHEPIIKDMKEKFDSLYLEIQQAIEKAEKWDKLESGFREKPDWSKIQFVAVSEYNKENPIISEFSNHYECRIEELQQQIKQLKEKLEKIRELVDKGYFTYDEFDDDCNLILTETEYTDKLKQILDK